MFAVDCRYIFKEKTDNKQFNSILVKGDIVQRDLTSEVGWKNEENCIQSRVSQSRSSPEGRNCSLHDLFHPSSE